MTPQHACGRRGDKSKEKIDKYNNKLLENVKILMPKQAIITLINSCRYKNSHSCSNSSDSNNDSES